jgi:hypothetical protein
MILAGKRGLIAGFPEFKDITQFWLAKTDGFRSDMADGSGKFGLIPNHYIKHAASESVHFGRSV